MDDAARYAPFSAQEREALAASGIEAAHTEEALRYFAEQRARGERGDGAHTFDMPEIDNEQVIDTRDDVPLRMPYRQCVVALAKYIPYAQLQSLLPAVERRTSEGVVQWNNALLAEVGRALYHTCAYGMFNGGSATSYTDAIHNQNLNAQLFEQWRERIDNSARAYGQLPKGLCPALYNRDGEGAWSFMELHIRHLVRESARCGRAIPLFQMTSPSSDAHIRDATREIYARYLPAEEACDHYALSGDMLCAVQPLLATFAYDARAGSLFDAGRQQQQDAGRQQQDAGRQQQQDAGWQQQDAGRQSQQDAGRQSQQDEGWQSQQDAGRRQQQDAGWQPRDTGGAGVPNGAEVKNGAGIGGGAGVPNGAEVKDSAGIGDGRSVANGVSVESGTGVLNGADIDGGTDIKSRASMAAEKATTAPADSEKAGVNGGAGIGSGTDVENGAEVKNGAGVGGGTGVPNGAEVKDSAGVPRSTPPLFMDPRAEKRRAYGLPGGHGQCFGVLRTLLEALFARGVRFVWLGNVDNVGYTMNPIALAYLVLRGGEALFEAVPRSTVDRKGGVLVRDGDGQVRCMELGGEVRLAQVLDAEREGKTTLFNCAIGLFNVETLLLKMDTYMKRLPVHALHKKTVRGDYWQLEQITWDIIGLIDNPCICIGHKSERFLAAKLISESFLLSGLPTQQRTALTDIGAQMCAAMQKKAQEEYGIAYKEGKWHAQNM